MIMEKRFFTKNYIFIFIFIFIFQIGFISSGAISVLGCRGTPTACITLTSTSCYCDSTTGVTPCKLTGFTSTNYCNVEGDYYIKSSSTCQATLTSTPTYVFAFNIDGDHNQQECGCVGDIWINTFCCGNDAFEYYNGAGSCDGTDACCASTSYYVKDGGCVNICAEIIRASWIDFAEQPISKAGVGATVSLLAETEYFGDKNVNFIIYNDDNEVVDFINDVNQESETKIITWKIPKVGSYYFKVKSSDDSTNILISNTLIVRDDEFNLPPFANIYSPVHESIFMKDELILFSANGSYDEDDFITSTVWDLDDDKISEEWEFQESYSAKGIKEIKLKVVGGDVSEGRDREDWDFASILICEGPGIYVFANISYPDDGELINQNSIEFKSEGSYAMDCSDNACAICNYVDLDFFEWTLFKNTMESLGMTSSEPTWNVTNLANFGEYIIKLIVGKDNVIETTEKEFKVYNDYNYPALVCLEPDRVSWLNLTDNSLINSLIDCFKENRGGTCCPEDYECVDDICVTNDSIDYFLCSDYTTKEQCNDFNLNVAKTSISNIREDEKTCPEIIDFIDGCLYSLENCKCEWDTTNLSCMAVVNISSAGCDESSPAPPEIGTCYYTENTEDNCDDGFLTYAWDASWQWSPLNPFQEDPLNEELNCVGGSNIVPCSAQVQLPFFNLISLLTSLLIIALIYFAWIFNNKKFSKKNKK